MGVFVGGCVYEREGGKQKERQRKRKREREMSVEWKQKPAQYKVK